ncbi:hypothetical protein MSPP1_001859 [Malassezia sp. CBS 17886]|nr:hypothetical protein MSPP1_001859 [Malassezia sp. CBS 17886]
MRHHRVPTPLCERPLDAFYFAFFALHAVASMCVDIQGLVPASWVPHVFRAVLQDYLVKSGDPLVPNAWYPRYMWFRVSMFSEFLLQVPTFVLGLWALWRDDKRVYPLLIAYGAVASFTTLQCIATVVGGEERIALTDAHLMFLLANYIPFAAVPLLILVDTSVRTTRLLAQTREKSE